MNARRLLLSAAISFGLVALAWAGTGEALSRPAARLIGPPPGDLNASTVKIKSAAGEVVAGWFIRGTERRGGVLLLHGVRADRTAMVSRARFLAGQGYSVLLVDLPAHGESTGRRITFGLNEGVGVRAALEYLRLELPGEPVAVIGVSLGAAAMVLSKASPAPNAVVLESMFPTIEEAVADRLTMRLGPAGKVLVAPLLWELPLFLGVSADQLRPIAELPSIGAAVLVISGTKDQHTTLAESQRVFEAAHEPKEFWAVEGAAHVDLHTFARKAYESKVSSFLSVHLRGGV